MRIRHPPGLRGFRGALLASRDMSGSPSGPGGRGGEEEAGVYAHPLWLSLLASKGLPSSETALLNAVLGSKRKGLEQSQHLSPWIFPADLVRTKSLFFNFCLGLDCFLLFHTRGGVILEIRDAPWSPQHPARVGWMWEPSTELSLTWLDQPPGARAHCLSAPL